MISFREYERRLTANRTSDIESNTTPEINLDDDTKTQERAVFAAKCQTKTTISCESELLNDPSPGTKSLSLDSTTRASSSIADPPDDGREDFIHDAELQSNDVVSTEFSNCALNEDDVIAELQNIIAQEEIEMENCASSLSFSSKEDHLIIEDNMEKVGSHEKLLSDNDINSEIKLLSNSLSDEIESLKIDHDELLLSHSKLNNLAANYPCPDESAEGIVELEKTHDQVDQSEKSYEAPTFENFTDFSQKAEKEVDVDNKTISDPFTTIEEVKSESILMPLNSELESEEVSESYSSKGPVTFLKFCLLGT